MAVSPTAWLHDQVKTQLDLGHSWLQHKNRQKAHFDRPSTAIDRKWEGIYHDNGSCIDIIGPCSCEPVQVFVLQTKPLAITDGHHHTEASLTAACLSDLRARYPRRETAVGTVWTVKKYTIRYTSYGPPLDKLRLLLDTVDWVGECHKSKFCLRPLAALHHSEDIASTLQQLHNTRVQEDDRCLRSQPKEEDHTDNEAHAMAGADEPLDEDTSMDTQMPFGTQMQHPIRSRTHDEDIAFVGINRLEPVLAGNTQRADLKYASTKLALQQQEQQRQAKLLSLLGKTSHAQAPMRSERRSEDQTAATPPRPRQTSDQRTSREEIDEPATGSIQTPTDNGKKRMPEVENESPTAPHSTKKTSFSDNGPEQTEAASTMDKFAAECSWMKGLKFDRASSVVPEDQAYILKKPESWYKPQGGQRFPSANIPVQTFVTLSRLADQKAALEGAASSSSYNETDPSSASNPPTSAPQPVDESESSSEEDAPTSLMSWSPTPEPPERPALPQQELPPDSSLEMPEDVAKPAVVHEPAAREISPHPTLPASSNEHEVDVPPSSPPAAQAAIDSDDDMEMEFSVPQALGEDTEARRASRLGQDHTLRTNPREMSVVQVEETPYVKGKNVQQPLVTISPPTQESTKHLNNSSSASIVRGTYQEMSSSAVEETRLEALHSSNCNTQQDIDLPVQSNQAQDLLSGNDAPDVAMFDEFAKEPPLDLVLQAGRLEQAHGTQSERIQELAPARPEPTPMSAQLPPKESSSGDQSAPGPVDTAVVASMSPETETSRQPSAAPSLTKRKIDTTSSKGRRPKRLKMVSFSGRDPKIIRREHAEYLRRSENERQQSSTSVESRHGSVSNASVQQDAETRVDNQGSTKPQGDGSSAAVRGNMSPRHQSLYAPPSPRLRPAATHTAASITESTHINQPKLDAPVDNVNQPVEVQQTQVQPRAKSPSDPQLESSVEPSSVSVPMPKPSQPSSEVPVRVESILPAAPADVPITLTVFQTFKTAYPEYKGDAKHFKNQCVQMEELDRDDRMVPKWMWDDFIIRNRTHYKDYVIECIDAGEEPMSYIRFYKDTIQDAIYKKGVIETRAVLLRALQELGAQPRTVDILTPGHPPRQHSTRVHQSHQSPVQRFLQQPVQESSQQHARPVQSPMPSPTQPATTLPKKKPSRKSLPFARPSDPQPDRNNNAPHVRHSLPANPSHNAPVPTPTSSTTRKPRSSLAEKLHRLTTSLPPSTLAPGTGDQYRDFLRSQPRLTSTTGSTRVSATPAPTNSSTSEPMGLNTSASARAKYEQTDAKKSWPENLHPRPEVRDLPRERVDVLKWGEDM